MQLPSSWAARPQLLRSLQTDAFISLHRQEIPAGSFAGARCRHAGRLTLLRPRRALRKFSTAVSSILQPGMPIRIETTRYCGSFLTAAIDSGTLPSAALLFEPLPFPIAMSCEPVDRADVKLPLVGLGRSRETAVNRFPQTWCQTTWRRFSRFFPKDRLHNLKAPDASARVIRSSGISNFRGDRPHG